MSGMEEQNPTLTEEAQGDEISRLQAIPSEILDNILSFLLEEPIAGNQLDYALELYKRTRNLRSSSKYFNHTIEELILFRCSSILRKFDASERPDFFDHSNSDLPLFLFSLLATEEDAIVRLKNYALLKIAFEKNIIFIRINQITHNPKLDFDFNKGTDEEIIALIELLCPIRLNKNINEYEKRITYSYSSYHIEQCLHEAARKSLLKKLTESSFGYLITYGLSRDIINYHLDAINLSPQDFPRYSDGRFMYHLNPLKWAIIFDDIQILQQILDYLNNNLPQAYNSQIFDMLYFASAVANPETLDYLLSYCKTYNNQALLEYFNGRNNPNNHPLQRVFDTGNEKNFLVLIKHGARIAGLNLRETPHNKNSHLFQKLIHYQNYIGQFQNQLKKCARGNISPQKMVKIIEEAPSHKYYIKRTLVALGIAVIGLIGYQRLNKNNHIDLMQKTRIKT